MNILIEGWRGINHSFAIVNQFQISELIKSNNVFFKDTPFASNKWSTKKNSSGLEKNLIDLINKIPHPALNQRHDVTYRISFPFNFDNQFNSELLFVFGNCEYKILSKQKYINNLPDNLKYEQNFYIHTPSNWSKIGFLKAGFREDQVIVVPHGVDLNTFNLIPNDEKKILRKKYKLQVEDFILTNIGAMTQNKGVEALVAAYGILKKKYKNLKLILKDQSNLYNITANDRIKKLFNSEFDKKFKIINDDMINDIIIISENLNFEELKNIYSITDCYVSPYMAEGFNMTPLEAAACGTQIVVTKGGSTDDYFEECMGYQIESFEKKAGNDTLLNPKLDSLIDILTNIINKSDEMKLKRSNFVRKNFSWENVTNQLKKEFENKLSK